MRVQRFSSTVKTSRLYNARLFPCLLAFAFMLVAAARLGEHKTFAQTSPVSPTATRQLGISPDEPVVPAEQIVVNTPAKNTAPPDKAAENIQASKEKQALPPIPDPDPKNPVAVQSANLLRMAYSLKSEVDKSTKDTLSVAVVRQATEIEQMAHKMRSK